MPAKPRKKTHCADCGKFVLIIDTKKSPNGDFLCVECFKKTCIICGRCHKAVFISDANDTPDSRVSYCDACFAAECVKCHECGDPVWKFSHYDDPDDHHICETCYEDNCFECYDCGGVFWLDDSRESNGDLFCESCFRHIDSYGDDFSATAFNGAKNYSKVGSTRQFGVEIETHECSGYMNLRNKVPFTAKDDCSVAGKEFASAILYGNDGLAAIKRLCDFAHENHWTVDRHCGLHIHLDMQNEGAKALRAITAAYYLTYEIWKRFVDSNRVNNYYCARHYGSVDSLNTATNFATYAIRQSRYEWLNLNAYRKFQSFEIRLHHGSIDSKEICNWIRAHAVFMDWAAGFSLRQVKAIFADMTENQKFDFIANLWSEAGCEDLIKYYFDKGRDNGADWVHYSITDKMDCAVA